VVWRRHAVEPANMAEELRALGTVPSTGDKTGQQPLSFL
jgi:hypothetical protein